ncbi:MAG: hypothetical protein ABI895_10355 [Deltaproteobacteria bacterium]
MTARRGSRPFRLRLFGALVLTWGLANAAAPSLARVGSLSIDVATFAARAARLAPFQRTRFGAAWPEQRRRFLEQELVREAVLEIEASNDDRRLASARDTALARALLAQLEQGVETAGVPADQIASYYAQHRQSYEAPRSVLIWRILLRQEAEARALLHELGTPTESNWSRLARERSFDTATQMRSGSLGYVAADGQTHLPQVRVAATLFAAADRVRDGQLVPEPVVEGAAFAVVWRRGSRAATSSQLAAVSVDIGAVLVQERFANETRTLIERLRQDSVRDYQPALLAGFEPRSLDVLEPASPALQAALEARPVVLSPRARDTGLR